MALYRTCDWAFQKLHRCFSEDQTTGLRLACVVQYIENYQQREGIRVDYDKIYKNPSARAGAKQELNNAWGYFGQDPHKAETEIVQDALHFHELLMNELSKVTARQTD